MDAQTLCNKIATSEYAFTATLRDTSAKRMGLSNPPIHHVNLHFSDYESIKEPIPTHASAFHYFIRSDKLPQFVEGRKYIVCGHVAQSVYTADVVVEYSPDLLKNQMILPCGWQLSGTNELISPFPVVKPPPRWYNNYKEVKCSKTGRPALLAGSNVELAVEQIIPPDADEYINPYGDGKFKLTLTNKADYSMVVPALLHDNGTISWEDSLIIIDGECDKVYTLPGCCQKQDLKSYELRPHEKVSVIVNALALPGDECWFVGGTRVHLNFALGDVMKQNFFYCYSSRHEKMHNEAVNKSAIETFK